MIQAKTRIAHIVLATSGALLLSSAAEAFHSDIRFVERVGNVDTVISGGSWTIPVNSASHLRVQFIVVDDASGPAPAGGFEGWSLGTITTPGPAFFTNTRTPGRLSPFTSPPSASANGSPTGDPFSMLDSIDAHVGIQSPFWGFDGNGMPLPQPPAVVRGLNTFVSVYEITTVPLVTGTYNFTYGGNLFGATSWNVLGVPVPPDPVFGTPGSVQYAPVPIQLFQPESFERTLTVNVVVPGPGAGVVLAASMGAVLTRRRRQTV